MNDVTFLGTSGSLPNRERDNAAFLLRSGGNAVLIDCPGSVVQKILRAGTAPLEIRHLLITHIHPDHVYGLASLVHGLTLHDHTISLYGSAETTEFCRAYLDLFELRKPKVRTRVEFVPLGPDATARLAGGLEVTAFRVPHQSSSLGFRFRSSPGGRTLVFSGDTPIHPGLFERAENADLLVHDCGAPSRAFLQYPALSNVHTNALDLGAWGAKAGVRLLAPCHFLTEVPFTMSELQQEIRREYSGRLFIPADMDRLVVE